ncbi:MAG: hypothetical protein A3H01_00625 [Candidatus Wildermuthbacteria bacterium RIFCSPLOWO2_12_FULL_40_9]|uniref:Prepilin-type N-terminal cleavage/methylation domain-containing protein n=2 Tax=Candidatus Wildermuthiibacteriota TaxID=1817923 RepID=A0A1G2RBZ8_9BACT|nr:MAG: hypothetical protein A3F15_02435 [Candidatus Wildermuthbacteria bacterium RIFCSPHIGHO2_12_FULL_40_12]OHA76108.1 MAG: hypothetical protein A3H01_00625 [Candidatus Wildermuthbacteria bacterium RIFCSPLOWO2_12_FULL_40_9]
MRGGFTLVEILLVIGVFTALFYLVAPISLNFYKNQQLESVTQEIIQNLRKAQLKSVSVERDSSFGVHFGGTTYTLFQGNSFSNRDSQYDEVFNIPQVIKMGGLEEVAFSKLNGIPSLIPAYCGGICAACDNFTSRNSCQAQSGCSWNRPLKICIGSCIACGDFTAQSSCVNQSGCFWNPEIIGGDVIIDAGGDTNTVNINEVGRINLQ